MSGRDELLDNVAQACLQISSLEAQIVSARARRDQALRDLRGGGLSWRAIPREVATVLARDYDHHARGVSMANVRLAVRRLDA